jgi:hypothetical protein
MPVVFYDVVKKIRLQQEKTGGRKGAIEMLGKV